MRSGLFRSRISEWQSDLLFRAKCSELFGTLAKLAGSHYSIETSMTWRLLGLAPAIYLICLGTIEAETIVFSRDIWPIFDRHCSECHGKNVQKAGLDFSGSFAFQRSRQILESLIVSGEPEQSELIKRVVHADREARMPLDRPSLSESELDVLGRWIS